MICGWRPPVLPTASPWSPPTSANLRESPDWQLRCGASLARVSDCAEQGFAGDGKQRPLRSRCLPHLKPDVPVTHELSGVLEPGQVTKFGDGGDSYRQLHATEGLECFDHRIEAPGMNLLVEFLIKTLEPFSVVGDSPDIFLEDD